MGTVSPEVFAQAVKEKHPEYKDVPDAQLASSVALKYPQYAKQIDWSAAAPKQPSNYKPPVSPHPTFDRVARGTVSAAPAILGGAGGVLGSAAGPVGAVAGAAYGGYLGEAIKQGAGMDTSKSEKQRLVQGAEQGAMELAGVGLAKGATALAPRLARGADEAMTKLLGMRFAKNPKLMRNTPDALREVGKVVNANVKTAGGLESLATKVGETKQALVKGTEDIVQNTTGSKLVPFDRILYDSGIKAQDSAIANGLEGRVKAIDQLVDTLEKRLPSNAHPKDILDLRRTLLTETDKAGQPLWPAGTRQFRLQLYHSLNDGIKQALPVEAAGKFAANNYKVSKLILAEDALKEQMAKKVTGSEKSSVMELAKMAGKHAILPAAGGAEGYRRGGAAGAIAGAAIGAGASAALASVGGQMTGIAARKLAAKVLPKAAPVLRSAPALVRATETARSIKSNPEN